MAEAYAGLQAQALGLAEAAGLAPEVRTLQPRAPWRWLPAAHWPAPLAAVGFDAATAAGPGDRRGGVAAAVGAALRQPAAAASSRCSTRAWTWANSTWSW